MNSSILVSIVVPAFNVEKYIEKCIRSILAQTYINIELIVINDGSTDKTLSVIKSIQDERMIIIDKKNGGVSSARNSGLDVAKGKYITFVDGDDYLFKDFIEYFVFQAEKYNSDFVFSTKCITKKKEKFFEESIKEIDNYKATSLLLNPDVIVGCWNKLYRLSFLKDNNIFFSTNLFYGEGLHFINSVAQMANNIIVLSCKKYYYRRNNEMSATTVFNIDKYLNGEKSLSTIYSSLTKKNKEVEVMFKLHLCLFYLGGILSLLQNDCKQIYKIEYNRWKKIINRNYWTIFFSKYINLYRKVILFVGCICPRILSIMDKKRRKKIHDESVN